MNDDRLIRDLRALDRPVMVDVAFAERLFQRLSEHRRTRRRRPPYLLLAATLLIGASLAAAVISGGGRPPSDAPSVVAPVRQTWSMPTNRAPIQVGYAVPTDLDLTVSDRGGFLAFTPKGDVGYLLDNVTGKVPPGGRGVMITNVAGATAHYSDGRPLGLDAASFIRESARNHIVRADLGPVSSGVIGGVQGLTADLAGAAPGAHVDRDQVAIFFFSPSRVFVADLGDAIVFVQIWAATPDDLAAWLPDAERLIESFRFG